MVRNNFVVVADNCPVSYLWETWLKPRLEPVFETEDFSNFLPPR
jgi:hypothetical protein